MREPDFNSLKERLLRGGIAPKHVRRTIAELRDHHTDLFAESFSRGCSLEEAALEASIRLGDEDALATAIVARPELWSWAHRWPWVAYCLTPTALFLAAFAGLFLLLGFSGVVRLDHDTFLKRWGLLASGMRLFYLFGLPLVAGGVSCVLAGRRRADLRWPTIGVVIVSIIGGVLQFDVCWPNGANTHGAFCMSIDILSFVWRPGVSPFPGFASTLLRVLATCALTLGPYLWWRRRAVRA
jgi:hypothetical protein